MLTHQVALPDTTLAVRTRGSGTPLVLLHAFPLDGRMWEAQEPLADHVRLIVPDLRGFGGSRGPGPASIEQLADDTVALLDEHDDDGAVAEARAAFCDVYRRPFDTRDVADRLAVLSQAAFGGR